MLAKLMDTFFHGLFTNFFTYLKSKYYIIFICSSRAQMELKLNLKNFFFNFFSQF